MFVFLSSKIFATKIILWLYFHLFLVFEWTQINWLKIIFWRHFLKCATYRSNLFLFYPDWNWSKFVELHRCFCFHEKIWVMISKPNVSNRWLFSFRQSSKIELNTDFSSKCKSHFEIVYKAMISKLNMFNLKLQSMNYMFYEHTDVHLIKFY